MLSDSGNEYRDVEKRWCLLGATMIVLKNPVGKWCPLSRRVLALSCGVDFHFHTTLHLLSHEIMIRSIN